MNKLLGSVLLVLPLLSSLSFAEKLQLIDPRTPSDKYGARLATYADELVTGQNIRLTKVGNAMLWDFDGLSKREVECRADWYIKDGNSSAEHLNDHLKVFHCRSTSRKLEKLGSKESVRQAKCEQLTHKLDPKNTHMLTLKAAKSEKDATLVLLEHLAVIDEQRVYAVMGYPTLWMYVHQALGFSEPQTSERINAMRLMKKIPSVKQELESGKLTLTVTSKLASHVKREECMSMLILGNDVKVESILSLTISQKLSQRGEDMVWNQSDIYAKATICSLQSKNLGLKK